MCRALRREGGAGVETLVVDLSLAQAVRKLVDVLAARGERIDVLQNNVGVLLDDFSRTAEGCETSLATNLLNHYLLTESLIARGLLARDAVVVNMSSGGMYNVPLLVAALPMSPANYNGVADYALHKRAQVVLNAWWRRREAAGGRAFYVMHPGWCDTAGVRTSLPRFRALLKSLLRDEVQGADTALWLAATRPEQRDDEAVWFDRKPRSAHVQAHTRRRSDSVEALLAILEWGTQAHRASRRCLNPDLRGARCLPVPAAGLPLRALGHCRALGSDPTRSRRPTRRGTRIRRSPIRMETIDVAQVTDSRRRRVHCYRRIGLRRRRHDDKGRGYHHHGPAVDRPAESA